MDAVLLLGAPGLTTRSSKDGGASWLTTTLLGAPGLTTRSKD